MVKDLRDSDSCPSENEQKLILSKKLLKRLLKKIAKNFYSFTFSEKGKEILLRLFSGAQVNLQVIDENSKVKNNQEQPKSFNEKTGQLSEESLDYFFSKLEITDFLKCCLNKEASQLISSFIPIEAKPKLSYFALKVTELLANSYINDSELTSSKSYYKQPLIKLLSSKKGNKLLKLFIQYSNDYLKNDLLLKFKKLLSNHIKIINTSDNTENELVISNLKNNIKLLKEELSKGVENSKSTLMEKLNKKDKHKNTKDEKSKAKVKLNQNTLNHLNNLEAKECIENELLSGNNNHVSWKSDLCNIRNTNNLLNNNNFDSFNFNKNAFSNSHGIIQGSVSSNGYNGSFNQIVRDSVVPGVYSTGNQVNAIDFNCYNRNYFNLPQNQYYTHFDTQVNYNHSNNTYFNNNCLSEISCNYNNCNTMQAPINANISTNNYNPLFHINQNNYVQIGKGNQQTRTLLNPNAKKVNNQDYSNNFLINGYYQNNFNSIGMEKMMLNNNPFNN